MVILQVRLDRVGKALMTTILIAEDNDDVRAVLKRLLNRAGFSVLTAPDGRAALSTTREHRPDVVLTDLDMPHLDGMELCAAIRKDPAPADTPVAILSGGLQPGDPRTAGVQLCDVLLKPFVNGDLISAVRRVADTGRHHHHAPLFCRGLTSPKRAGEAVGDYAVHALLRVCAITML
ncbi:response regulator [Actinoplanes sp. NPDC051475]|uniref:response regulator n=1 Tax=Actinoplanes sp. NPDC051475 TaxID=3157225 RepID=UPI003450410C